MYTVAERHDAVVVLCESDVGAAGTVVMGGFVLGDKGVGFLSDADGAGWRTLVLMALIWGSVEVPVREGRRVDQSQSVQDQIALA